MSDFSYEIIKHIGVIDKSQNDWTKELNIISYNGAKPKYDIRDWSPNHEQMGKGITLTDYQMQKLIELLKEEY